MHHHGTLGPVLPDRRLENEPERLRRTGASAAAADIGVVGLGYAGLLLAVSFAELGYRVLGIERRQEVVDSLGRGKPPFAERGLSEALNRTIGRGFTVSDKLPDTLPETVILCVGTPIGADCEPRLDDLKNVCEDIAARAPDDLLLIVRSTVPVGTCRNILLPILRDRVRRLSIAFCPERTIQGRALEEIASLPQIIGGLDDASWERAATLFGHLAKRLHRVSSLEVAEMTKLVNNCHTDVLYGFGNEVAHVAEVFSVDAAEVIRAANLDYPRPDIAKPGFVGGGCLSKDPYLLLGSMGGRADDLKIIRAARQTNAALPARAVDLLLAECRRTGHSGAARTALICGFAFKGEPETDDVRDAPAIEFAARLAAAGFTVFGHDPVVRTSRIAAFGATPVELEEGLASADVVVLATNHAAYRHLDIADIAERGRLRVLFDAWALYAGERHAFPADLSYLTLGQRCHAAN